MSPMQGRFIVFGDERVVPGVELFSPQPFDILFPCLLYIPGPLPHCWAQLPLFPVMLASGMYLQKGNRLNLTGRCCAGVDFAEGQPFFEAFAFHNIPGYADNLKVIRSSTADRSSCEPLHETLVKKKTAQSYIKVCRAPRRPPFQCL